MATSTTNYTTLRNPLSSFSSSTYKISLYSITADSVNDFYLSGKWNTTKLELIVQSGGVTGSVDSPRNKWFNYDFGIDNLEIVTQLAGKETGASTNNTDFTFQIFEPYSMTFASRLVNLQKELQAASKIRKDINQQVDAINTPFLLVVRFYGYDAAGNIVAGAPDTTLPTFTTTNDAAAYERSWALHVTSLTFKLDNKVTIYSIKAKPIHEQVAFGTKRGIINQPINFTADTVENAVGGVATKKTNGLMDRVNSVQPYLAGTTTIDKKQQFSDQYKTRFEDNSIAEALIVPQDYWVKSRAPFSSVKNSSQSTVKTSAVNQAVVRGQRQIDLPPGTPILTAIQQIITQSDYITAALNAIDKEQIQPVIETDRSSEANPKPTELSWFNVTSEIRYLDWDTKRLDFAYEITYVIQKYEIPYVSSVYATTGSRYPGPSKVYQYFYTGENSEVLSYEQDYNLLFFNASASTSSAGVNTPAGSVSNQPMASMGADPTGKESGKFEIPNSIKTYLYSPGDLINTRMKILGDPDLLISTRSSYSNPFELNPNRGQFFIEVEFKQVEDYNVDENGEYIENGTMTPNGNIIFWDYPPEIEAKAKGKMIYIVRESISKFSNGVFTQDLKMMLPTWPALPKTPQDDKARPPEVTSASSSSTASTTSPSRVPASTSGTKVSGREKISSDFDPLGNAVPTKISSSNGTPPPTSERQQEPYRVQISGVPGRVWAPDDASRSTPSPSAPPADSDGRETSVPLTSGRTTP